MLIYVTATDTGKFVKGILLNREKTLGKRIYAATDYYTIDEIVKEFREQYPVAGEGTKSVELPYGDYKAALGKAGLPEESKVDLLENMRPMAEFGYYGGALLKESHDVSFGSAILSWMSTNLFLLL